MNNGIVRLEAVTKHYGSLTAVDAIDLTIEEGEFLTLLGPSGCGKTTTLRMIAGYISVSLGEIYLDGKPITSLPPQKRHIGMVFQSYALFPHMTISDNIAFGLRIKKAPRETIDRRVAEMLELVQLTRLGKRYPHELSGGQQQRVALARALAFNPRILLSDESLGSLDLKLREAMQLELKRIQRELGITTVHVTHDQEEALSMSDRIVVMDQGRIAQVGTCRDIYERPKTRFVADFVGKINLVSAQVAGVSKESVTCVITSSPKTRFVCCPDEPWEAVAGASQPVVIGIRPEHIRITETGQDFNCVEGVVEKIKFAGSHQVLFVRLPDGPPLMVYDHSQRHSVGDKIILQWPPDKTLLYEA